MLLIVMTILACWVAANVLIIIVAVFYTLVERRLGHDPLDAVFNEERLHRATITHLYPHRCRRVVGVHRHMPRRRSSDDLR